MRIRRVVPDIQTDRMEESRAFYAGVIGMRETMDLGWIVGFTSESNATAQLQLLTSDASAPLPPQVTIETDDVDGAWQRATKGGCEIAYPLTTEPWGVRRFFVRDPNGVVINVMSHEGT